LAGVWEVGSLQLVSEQESIEICCSCCCGVCVVSVVARRVRAVMARLVLDLLAVVFLVWRTLAGESRCGAPDVLCAVLHRWLSAATLVYGCLSASCWLVVSSGEVLPESFSVGSCEKPFDVVLNGAFVVLVEVLPRPACVTSIVLLTAVFSLMVCVLWSLGLCILVKVLPRITFVASGGGRLLALLMEVLPKAALCLLWSSLLFLCGDDLSSLPWDFVCPHGSDGSFCFPAPCVLSQMVVWWV
ncbi:hypothetical protein Taro_041579, partial [Colocasia esculenta]|nr:hypothetical protein [Colocasia esculenta]